MQDKKQLIIFARAPQAGLVKRRLAHDIGESEALRFYEATLASLIARLRVGPWSLCISVASPEGINHPVFSNVETRAQPDGDLGFRMKSALNEYAGSNTARVIIGSDIPAIQPVHIDNAFTALETNDLVFGPASDGGFWLVGCAADYPASLSEQERFMTNVRWSTNLSLADTLATIAAEQRIAMLETLSDVDDGRSYRQHLEQSS